MRAMGGRLNRTARGGGYETTVGTDGRIRGLPDERRAHAVSHRLGDPRGAGGNAMMIDLQAVAQGVIILGVCWTALYLFHFAMASIFGEHWWM